MRSLIQFILKYQTLMLFLLLEVAALIMVIEKNEYQSAKYYNWSLATMGQLYKREREVRDYFFLKEINSELAEENAILKELLIKGQAGSPTAMLSILDPFAEKAVDYIPAKIVNASVGLQHNLLTINVGSEDSVATDMAVLSPLGAVGVVKSVSRHYAMVLPIINVEYRVSSKLYNSNYFGTLEWDTHNYRFASLKNIEQHVNVSIGDSIVTSGFGAVYPEGVMVGTVAQIIPGEEGVFHEIKVQLATDFRKLSYVYVVKNKQQEERQELEEITQNN